MDDDLWNWSSWTIRVEYYPFPVVVAEPRKSAEIIHMSQEDFRKGHKRKKSNGSNSKNL